MANFAVTLAVPSAIVAFGMVPMYAFFAFVCFCGGTMVYHCVLETKGRSLEQIDAMFAHDAKKDNNSDKEQTSHNNIKSRLSLSQELQTVN
jgi:hypothetical protein